MITDSYLTSRTWVEIKKGALRHNLDEIKKAVPKGTKIMAVVKANAYGHGAKMLSELIKDDVYAFGVASLYEALELRRSGVKNDILILGWTSPELFSELIEADIMPAIFSGSDMKVLSDTAKKQGKTARCFLALDTGMTRIGFSCTESGLEEAKSCFRQDSVLVEGIFSHYACSDDPDKTVSYLQKQKFDSFISELKKCGIKIPICSIDNSAAIMELPVEREMVRAGIILYGIKPDSEMKDGALDLIPALSLKTRVETVKTVPSGVGVSYGHTYKTSRETRIATLCCGYADGLPRLLSDCGDILIHGKRARILGRVCMDQVMVDVTDIDSVLPGDIATVIGSDGNEVITADEVAKKALTIPYEIVCSLDRDRIPKIYIE